MPGWEDISAADSAAKPLLHLWSLSIEEQFYLAWSVLLLALFKLANRLLPHVILALFTASFAYCVVLTPVNPIGAFYLPWTRAWELALGALLAYREVFLLLEWPYPSRRLADVGAGLGVALILAAIFSSAKRAVSRAGARRSRRRDARSSSPIPARCPAKSRSATGSPPSSD